MGNSIGASSDARGQRPCDVRRLTGVAGVHPVNVPVLFERELKARLQGSTGSDARPESDQFRSEMLRFYRARAAIADNLKLRICGWMKEEDTDKNEQRVEAANGHQSRL